MGKRKVESNAISNKFARLTDLGPPPPLEELDDLEDEIAMPPWPVIPAANIPPAHDPPENLVSCYETAFKDTVKALRECGVTQDYPTDENFRVMFMNLYNTFDNGRAKLKNMKQVETKGAAEQNWATETSSYARGVVLNKR